MKTQEQYQWHRSPVFISNCEHISDFVLIIDFEQANVFLVHIEKANTFEDKIGYIMRYVVVFMCIFDVFSVLIWRLIALYKKV